MNDSELDKTLQSAAGPRLEPEYQQAFPQRVLANLRSAPGQIARVEHPWRLRLAWATAAAACILAAFLAGRWHGRLEAGRDVLADSKLIQQTMAMFPNRVRAIVRDQRGINLVLSDRDDVPASTPIYVRICDGRNCSSAVTFSGQEIQLAGQKLTVLAEANGGIILEGSEFVWSSTERAVTAGHLRIEARNLGPATM